ncbi:ras guanine nucleotide exchange factor domain-containing protein [Favolaschia claudopus]|uniref:Ras guanine nucleotide exchange factor domain-containing protein n=1 Tax=Favolaschia claudopus TaxID=2862362 RepID=A0AAW0D6D9_9AGAR
MPTSSSFCRALHDYDAQDSACLSFRRHDLIEIVTRAPSGWWVGSVQDKSGWFPSSYVTAVVAQDASRRRIISSENGDFWMPQVTSDGRIFYVNTESGQHAQDIPTEDMEAALSLGKFRAVGLTASGPMSFRHSRLMGDTRRNANQARRPREPSTYWDFDSDSDDEESPEIIVITEPLPSGPASPPIRLQQAPDPSEIVIDLEGTVCAGTVPALVERLTAHGFSDPAYLNAFLTTFKSFTTVSELLYLLVERFWIQPPPNLTAVERDEWVQSEQQLIRTRVLETLKYLLVHEELETVELDQIEEFLAINGVAKFSAAKKLSVLIEQARRGGAVNNLPPALSPYLPKSSKPLKLLDIQPLELAQQLTILDSRLYQCIKPADCLQQVWPQKTQTANSIVSFIQTSKNIRLWVVETVLTESDRRQRARIIDHFISIADHCRTLQNLSAMAAITFGLNTLAIRRLTRTWARVNPIFAGQLRACETLMISSKGSSNYRFMMKSVVPPCVPFLGFTISTLQSIKDGSPDTLPVHRDRAALLVNFKKRQSVADVVDEIKQWQVPYNLKVVPSIQNYVEDSLHSVDDIAAEHFDAMSLELEPR